jgi:integrase
MAYLWKREKGGRLYCSSKITVKGKLIENVQLNPHGYESMDVIEYRHEEVESKEAKIKMGISFEWNWLRDDDIKTKTRVKVKTIDFAIKCFLDAKKRGIRKTTYNKIKLALFHFSKSIGGSTPISLINLKHIDKFIEYSQTTIKYSCPKTRDKKEHSNSTINTNLSQLSSFFNWLKERNEFELHNFKIKKLTVDESKIICINEIELNAVLFELKQFLFSNSYNYELCSDVFKLYWDTGMRIKEGFYGNIKNNKLIVPPEYDKNHSWRIIKYLSDQHIKTIEKMQKIFKDKGGKRHHFMYYSELFKKCLRKARIRQLESKNDNSNKLVEIDDSKHFHCLRHSYGVRRRYETNGNLTQVRDEMGHKRLEITERYSNYDLDDINIDFPSTVKKVKMMAISSNLNTTILNTNQRNYVVYPR